MTNTEHFRLAAIVWSCLAFGNFVAVALPHAETSLARAAERSFFQAVALVVFALLLSRWGK